jgi:uncharacterized membrane protein
MTYHDAGATSDDKTMPAVCYALYLLAFATGGLTALVGAVIGHAQQKQASATMRTHYTFMIRTFWIGLVALVASGIVMGVGAILSIIVIGIPIMGLAGLMFAATAVWYGVRCIVGLVYLSRGEPYPRPYAVLA